MDDLDRDVVMDFPAVPPVGVPTNSPGDNKLRMLDGKLCYCSGVDTPGRVGSDSEAAIKAGDRSELEQFEPLMRPGRADNTKGKLANNHAALLFRLRSFDEARRIFEAIDGDRSNDRAARQCARHNLALIGEAKQADP